MTLQYIYKGNVAWVVAMVLLAAFACPLFLVGLCPLPEKWSKHLPVTYTKKVTQ